MANSNVDGESDDDGDGAEGNFGDDGDDDDRQSLPFAAVARNGATMPTKNKHNNQTVMADLADPNDACVGGPKTGRAQRVDATVWPTAARRGRMGADSSSARALAS